MSLLTWWRKLWSRNRKVRCTYEVPSPEGVFYKAPCGKEAFRFYIPRGATGKATAFCETHCNQFHPDPAHDAHGMGWNMLEEVDENVYKVYEIMHS